MKTKTEINETTARRKAQKVLNREIGNLPGLEEAREEESKFIFPLVVRTPRIIFDRERENPKDVRFMSKTELGEIEVDKDSGDVIDRPEIWKVNNRIKKQRKEVRESVNRALVSSAAERFSKLPLSETRFTPIEDILSQVVMKGEIRNSQLELLNSNDKAKYEEYLEPLFELNLLRKENGRIEADDVLIEIEDQEDEKTEMVKLALAYFFKKGTHYMEDIKEILGPHLTLASYYYLQALETGNTPEIKEKELARELAKNYSGSERELKNFKLPRYLLQLEEVGIMQESSQDSWKGKEDVYESLLGNQELDSISEILA